MSDRASHQLVSHILKIILQEVLGYQDVQLKHGYNDMNATNILRRLSGCNMQGGYVACKGGM